MGESFIFQKWICLTCDICQDCDSLQNGSCLTCDMCQDCDSCQMCNSQDCAYSGGETGEWSGETSECCEDECACMSGQEGECDVGDDCPGELCDFE